MSRSLKQLTASRANIRRAQLHRLVNRDLMRVKKQFRLKGWKTD